MVNLLDMPLIKRISQKQGGQVAAATTTAPPVDLVKEVPLPPATPVVMPIKPPPMPEVKVVAVQEPEPEIELPEAVEKFMTQPIKEDGSSVRAASAVIGAIIGLAAGGPLLALMGAVLTSYSCTASNDAGDVARGSGKWAIGVYNFWAKLNSKYTVVSKVSKATAKWYRRFKRELPETQLLDRAEVSVGKVIKTTAEISTKYDLGEKVGDVLVKTGELSVVAVKTAIDYNEKYKVTDRLLSWLQSEVIKPLQERREMEMRAFNSTATLRTA